MFIAAREFHSVRGASVQSSRDKMDDFVKQKLGEWETEDLTDIRPSGESSRNVYKCNRILSHSIFCLKHCSTNVTAFLTDDRE